MSLKQAAQCLAKIIRREHGWVYTM
jgi:hypothetical protein